MKRILLVDDHPLLIEGLSSLIRAQSGMEVSGIARGTEEALALIEEESPDLMITELALPGRNGLELIKDLRVTNPEIRRTKRLWLEEQGFGDLQSVPDGHLSGIQARVKQHTAAGTVFFDAAGAAVDLAPYGFPAYFLDFETVQSAVPVWPGTRPYQQIPFQFSLHVLIAKGALIHHSFLDLSGDDPSRLCAESLIARCGSAGPVFAYHSPFECRVMRDLAERFPDLAMDLEAIIDRVVDLLPIVRNRYYHPSQHGVWSLKAVLPAAVPDLSYDALDGVANGGQAVAAYQEAIHPATPPERKAQLEAQLHAYSNLETLALVRLWKLFSGAYAMKQGTNLS